jgi:hypothetical protein
MLTLKIRARAWAIYWQHLRRLSLEVYHTAIASAGQTRAVGQEAEASAVTSQLAVQDGEHKLSDNEIWHYGCPLERNPAAALTVSQPRCSLSQSISWHRSLTKRSSWVVEHTLGRMHVILAFT